MSALIVTMSIPQNLFSQNVLMVVTNHDKLGNTIEKTGYWLSEVAHPYYTFLEAGYNIDFVSPLGGKPPVDPKSYTFNDNLITRFMQDTLAQKKLNNSFSPDKINPADYNIIFYTGGHGTMWDFPENKDLAQIAGKIYERGGIIGAVCHGPSALINIKLPNNKYLIDGREVTGFTNEEEIERGLAKTVPFLLQDELEKRGAIFIAGKKWEKNVVKSGNLVTGQNPASAKDVAREIISLLK